MHQKDTHPLRKRVLRITVLIVVIVIAIDLYRAYSLLEARRSDMLKAQNQVETLEEEKENLTRKFAGIQTSEYIEKQLREKLNMGKPGEVVVLVPTIVIPISPTPTPQLATWQKWVNLFTK